MEPTTVLAPHSPSRGVSLIELIVVIAIIGILTLITILGQSTFTKTIILTDTAYGVAFSARQAQSYGLSSRKLAGYSSDPGYGLHFDRTLPSSYIFFVDTDHSAFPYPTGCPLGVVGTPSAKPGNCRFDIADAKVNTYNFGRGYTVTRFCAKNPGQPADCSNTSSPLATLDLIFTRPNTSTTISGLINGTLLTTYSCAVITVADPTGAATRDIRVSALGEISVGNSFACP